MSVSYKKLWKMLIDRNMKKKDLARISGISQYTLTKMTRGDNVTIETLGRICISLGCGLDDIVEFIDKSNDDKRLS